MPGEKMFKLSILACILGACSCSAQSQTNEYSGDPGLLKLAFEPAIRNLDQVITWKGAAEITYAATQQSGHELKMRMKSSFVWDRNQATLRYRTDVIEKVQ
jgi:hypothetical protein